MLRHRRREWPQATFDPFPTQCFLLGQPASVGPRAKDQSTDHNPAQSERTLWPNGIFPGNRMIRIAVVFAPVSRKRAASILTPADYIMMSHAAPALLPRR